MQNIRFSDIEITDGYWKTRQDINKEVTLRAVYQQFKETHRFEALKCEWKDGDPYKPHFFWDSDVAKWMEGAAYILHSKDDEEIAAIIEGAIDCIIENRDENGYFNCFFLVTEQDNRFRNRDCHELYCAGHLIEAAVAYYEMTGKDRFLKAMCKFADYIEKVFKIDKSAAFITPGHPELELALMKLYRVTGEKRYADLAKYFIDEHGKHPEEIDPNFFGNEYYNQDELPIRDRKTAEGHCVRALYLMSGAADVASEYHDDALKEACDRFFDNIVNRRMYITGGVGSTDLGESFTVDYDLPNRTAYAETCAAISLALFANRMLQFGADAKYADIVEKTIYNGVMSGISLDGTSFFYENPLEIDPDFNHVNTSTKEKARLPITQRLPVFGCSCCPPNVLRFVASIADFLYSFDADTIYVHQYMDSKANKDGMQIVQKTAYPQNGKITVTCHADKQFMAFRIPGWCKTVRMNRPYTLRDNGYAYVALTGNDEIEIELDMPVRLMESNRRVHANAGRVAVMRGPVVYCAEGIDNGADIKSVSLDTQAAFEIVESENLLPNLKTKAYRPKANEGLYYEADTDEEEIPLTLIPYYAFANRGETEMQVWLLKK